MTPQATRPKAGIDTLAALIAMNAPYDGVFALPISGVSAVRISHPHRELTHHMQRSCMCLIAQGEKTVVIGDESFEYGAGQVAVYSVDVPVAARVSHAVPAKPYLNLMIELDATRIAEIAQKVFRHGVPQQRESGVLHVTESDPELVDAGARLLELLTRPSETELLAPLVLDEMVIRLLRSPIGARAAQIGREDSHVGRIAKAVAWLRDNFDQSADVEELAHMVNMSLTSFHRQFRAVTSMTPLQYQKTLRLQEARRLMLTASLDAGAAGRRVGYMSASQFTREYGRFFGDAPARDINRLREHGLAEASG